MTQAIRKNNVIIHCVVVSRISFQRIKVMTRDKIAAITIIALTLRHNIKIRRVTRVKQ